MAESVKSKKHRPSALSLDNPPKKVKMQDLAVDILSPGLKPEILDPEQQSTISSAKVIEEQQKSLIMAKKKVESQGGDPSTVVAAKSSNNSTPTIIIEQISRPDTGEPSPLPSAKKFKRSKAPPPLHISQAAVTPSIQTAPIRNPGHFQYGSKADFADSSRLIGSKLANRKSAAAVAAGGSAAALSPMASAFFAPRYFPGIAASPSGLTASMLNPYYRQMLMVKGAQLTTPRNPYFGNVPGAVPGAPMASSVQTPLSAMNPGVPITPLHQGFQAKPYLTASENYVINRNESSTVSEVNKDHKKRPAPIVKPDNSSTELRKSLQSPLASTIVKQTISTSLKKSAGGPKTPIHLQKSNTPHVTDVFPGDMTKFAPVSNQPISARDEHFDFNMYKDEPVDKSKKRKHDSIEEEDEDVESKAIEENSKMNLEIETSTVPLKTYDAKFTNYKIDLRIKTDTKHKVSKIRFQKAEGKKKGASNEKKEFIQACEKLWDEITNKEN